MMRNVIILSSEFSRERLGVSESVFQSIATAIPVFLDFGISSVNEIDR